MRRTLLLSAIGLGVLFLSDAVNAQGRQDFTLLNRTGYEINEVYIGPTSSSSWGRDILGRNTLQNGASWNVQFSSNATACRWDVKVVYTDGDESEFRNLNLCQISRVTLYWNRQAGTTRAVTE